MGHHKKTIRNLFILSRETSYIDSIPLPKINRSPLKIFHPTKKIRENRTIFLSFPPILSYPILVFAFIWSGFFSHPLNSGVRKEGVAFFPTAVISPGAKKSLVSGIFCWLLSHADDM